MKKYTIGFALAAVLMLTGCGREGSAERENAPTNTVTAMIASQTPSCTPTPTPPPMTHLLKEEWQLRDEQEDDKVLWLEYEYDTYGRKVRKSDYLSDTYDGTTYEYAEDGRVNWYRYGGGQIAEKGAWVFDENGNAVQVIAISGEDGAETVMYQDFDTRGNLSRTFSAYLNEYDESGRLVKTTQTTGDRTIGTSVYEYGGNGKLSLAAHYDGEGVQDAGTVYDEYGNPLEYWRTEGLGQRYVQFETDDGGSISGFTEFNEFGEPTYRFYVTYDSTGAVETIMKYAYGGEFLAGTRRVYCDVVIDEALPHNQALDYPYYRNRSLPQSFWEDWLENANN